MSDSGQNSFPHNFFFSKSWFEHCREDVIKHGQPIWGECRWQWLCLGALFPCAWSTWSAWCVYTQPVVPGQVWTLAIMASAMAAPCTHWDVQQDMQCNTVIILCQLIYFTAELQKVNTLKGPLSCYTSLWPKCALNWKKTCKLRSVRWLGVYYDWWFPLCGQMWSGL